MEETTLMQRAYTAVVEHFMKTGRAPHYTELATTLGVPAEEAKQAQHKAAEASIACWFVKDADYVESWAPFSNVPTHHFVTINGEQKWYGQ
jgi:DNA-directed RNA polymerase specialized sigma subunit